MLGANVRYDGGNEEQPALIESLVGQVEWIAFCPEDEAGLGTPRPPMHLEITAPQLRIIGDTSRTDYTNALEQWTHRQVAHLRARGIVACVLKARSPSCGVSDVPIVDVVSGDRRRGSGIFTHILRAAMPGLPVADESEVATAAGRTALLERARTYARRAPGRP